MTTVRKRKFMSMPLMAKNYNLVLNVITIMQFLFRIDGKYLKTNISGDGSIEILQEIYDRFLSEMHKIGFKSTILTKSKLVYSENPRGLLAAVKTIQSFQTSQLSSYSLTLELVMSVRKAMEFRMSLHKMLAEERKIDKTINSLEFVFPKSEV